MWDSLVSLVFEGTLFIPVLPLWLWFHGCRFQMAVSAWGTDPACKLSTECHSKFCSVLGRDNSIKNHPSIHNFLYIMSCFKKFREMENCQVLK